MLLKHASTAVEFVSREWPSSRVEQGEMGFELEDLPATSEFLQLTEHFNSMSRRLKQQFERIYMEQSALQDSRIRALQSQINPHFLNNTLEIINWEARMSNSEKVSKMIEALSTMLNAAMARDERPTVTLEEELSYVESYLYIISVRYGRRLSVHKEIDETLYDNEVPRLIMQPIVENAIDHGVAVNRSGEIWLRIYKKGQSLVMEVENNQPLQKRDEEAIAGLLAWPTEEARAEEGKASIGIRNVNARLKILYGPAYGLSIAASETGTLATILVPLDPEAEFSGGTPAE
ncbi:sensor histidine kinase [Christensenellaceae bacterium OttesenSCG-928-L17]|nr:sensor histidine kinase [Christensenellaceae bacterium OttesenSCG-928-L17]